MKITMSVKERDRLAAVRAVEAGQITQKQAAEQLSITERQVGRIVQRYRAEGDAGLIHRSRGRPSNRRIATEVKERAQELARVQYSDFGPTLAAEKLDERDGITVCKETVRQWMIEAGVHKPRPRKVTHLQWRERRACLGEMVQIDGSQHAWLEGRGEFEPHLLCIIDDATGRVFMQFAPAESTEAVMRLLHDCICAFGRPVKFYADRHSIYKTTRNASLEEQFEGIEAEPQMGRALRELDIRYIAAYSPQAKGRVERSFRTHQDRLIKEMRLEGICDIDAANRFLKERFIDEHNARFAVEPASSHDAHRSAEGFDLDAILSHQETRTVMNDYTISYHNTRYIGARLTRHARQVVLQMAEVAVTRDLFAQILSRIRQLKPVPT